MQKGIEKYWVFCNYTSMNLELIPTIVANLFYSIDRNEIRDHLKKLKQIKRELKKDPKGTPLRKKDRINYEKS